VRTAFLLGIAVSPAVNIAAAPALEWKPVLAAGWPPVALPLSPARGLTKRYGDRTAVDGLSFAAPPGQATGFLGPNGAGKSTTMRMIVGLDAPTGGTALVNGKPYAQHRAPLQELGVLLEARAVHPGRSVFSHLMVLAYTRGVPRRRVDEVIDLVGLHDVETNARHRLHPGLAAMLKQSKRPQGYSGRRGVACPGTAHPIGAAITHGDKDLLSAQAPARLTRGTADRLHPTTRAGMPSSS
jgi:hypothetical protein